MAKRKGVDGIDYDTIDERVRKLVRAMNRVPGVYTFSSCGGHPEPRAGQSSEGEFDISFDVRRRSEGWRALGLISAAILETEDWGKVQVVAWCSGQTAETLAFSLEGRGFADPDDLARAIDRFVRRDKRRDTRPQS